jgi:lipopolysaccharide biosynthesis glycosyltransferase/MoaA/NifB/PqqE/SkfB family radical SAM enzyme/glycosyltransferase involved in cell wall biosynthesis
MPTGVSITSLIKNKHPRTSYKIFVLGVNLSDQHKKLLESLSAENAEVKTLALADKDYTYDIHPSINYISRATYARFDIINIFKEYAAVLYLDGDTIIQTDLSSLFLINLANNYAGVVRDISLVFNDGRHRDYFNAGVLLLNLKKLRAEQVYSRLRELAAMHMNFRFNDQDILNIVFYKKVTFLSLTYNYIPQSMEKDTPPLEEILSLYEIESSELTRIRQAPAIVHYAAPEKPWTHFPLSFTEVWVNYYRLSPTKVLPIKRKRYIPIPPYIKRACPLSIIILVNNNTDALTNCINRLLAQTVKNLEIICIDNASDGSSGHILKDLANRQPDPITIFYPKGASPNPARNKALEIASGEYICFLDPADYYEQPQALEIILHTGWEERADLLSIHRSDQEQAPDPKTARKKAPFNISIIQPREYALSSSLQRNIFRKEFLLANAIWFPDYLTGGETVFLAKVLSQAERLVDIPLNIYIPESAPPKNQSQIIDFMKHYLEVTQILCEDYFKNTLSSYTEYFIRKLNALNLSSAEFTSSVLAACQNDLNLVNTFLTSLRQETPPKRPDTEEQQRTAPVPAPPEAQPSSERSAPGLGELVSRVSLRLRDPVFYKALKAQNLFRRPVCYAPVASLHFSFHGSVYACCYNYQDELGHYPENSIRQIWLGQKRARLTKNLNNYKFNNLCQRCRGQILNQNGNVFSSYDELMAHAIPEYPSSLVFNFANICNLECIMCSGVQSSSIRKNREAEAVEPVPYDEAFVEQLTEFIPHLKHANFLGGEPFLFPLHYKIWQTIARLNKNLPVYVTSNGSIYNKQVQAVLDSLPNLRILISLDSLNKATYESIRKNARFETVMENVQRWIAQDRLAGICICPMIQNVYELPALAKFCEKHNLNFWLNVVDGPLSSVAPVAVPEFRLATLPCEQLLAIIEMLGKTEADYASPRIKATLRGFKQQILSYIQKDPAA